jgi:hypothetical protein
LGSNGQQGEEAGSKPGRRLPPRPKPPLRTTSTLPLSGFRRFFLHCVAKNYIGYYLCLQMIEHFRLNNQFLPVWIINPSDCFAHKVNEISNGLQIFIAAHSC